MIEIQNLTQTYPSGKGIFDVNFIIKEGECFGYLGPNGAGKTTTIRSLLGLMTPNKGTVCIQGLNPRVHAPTVNKIIGYLPGEMAFFKKHTGKQFLDFICSMRNITDLTYRNQLVKDFQLDTSVHIKKMSKGMKQKLGIITAFMHDPQILILDEPTSGLDPLMQNKLLDLISLQKEKGKTILMSSHIFEEIEKVCDRAGIIKDGRIVAIEDFSDSIWNRETYFTVTLRTDHDSLLQSPLNIRSLGHGKYEILVSDNYKELFQILSQYDIIDFESKKTSLESLFMKYYGGESHD